MTLDCRNRKITVKGHFLWRAAMVNALGGLHIFLTARHATRYRYPVVDWAFLWRAATVNALGGFPRFVTAFPCPVSFSG